MRDDLPLALPAGILALVLSLGLFVWSVTSRFEPEAADSGRFSRWREAFASADRERIDPALHEISASRTPPVEELLAFLRDADRGVREWGAHALGDLAPQREDVVDALRTAFDDPDDWVRWKAARALGRIGPPLALPALPALKLAAGSAQATEVVRASAQQAVAILEGRPPLGG